ncbi:MAG: YggT family protein [Ruaniaceae bacterium]|nr:YggT family protein [Ruaniaceae bacterium]
MSILFQLAAFAVSILIVLLIARAVFDWIRSFARGWRPSGFMLLLANISYTLTDPPISALRRVLPPLNLGGVSLDLGFLIVLIALIVVRLIFLVFVSAF